MSIEIETNNIQNVSSPSASQSINENFEVVKEGFEKALNKEGGADNSMQSDLDMDGNDLLNVGSINGRNVDDLVSTQGGDGLYSASDTIVTSAADDDYLSLQDTSDNGNPKRITKANLFDGLTVTAPHVIIGLKTPEDFGATGDGVVDDATALALWIAHGKSEQVPIALKHGSTYRTTDSLWFGTNTASGGVPAVYGNYATIVGECAGEPVCDLTGIRNDGKFLFVSVNVTGDDTDTPSCGILQGRPYNGGTVASSGNAKIMFCRCDGEFTSAAYYNIQSESNYVAYNFFFNDIGPAAVWALADILTAESPNATGGSLQTSTASHQIVNGNFFNNRSASSTDPAVIIDSWSSMDFSGNNLNVANAANSLMRIQQDETVLPLLSGICQDIIVTRNYFHNTHDASVQLGDPVTNGGTLKNIHVYSNSHVGNPNNDVACVNGQLLLTSCWLEVNCHLDLTGADCRDQSLLRVADNLATSITLDGVFEGDIFALSDTTFNITSSDVNFRGTIHYVDTGLKSYPRRTEVTIDTGSVGVSRPYHTIDTEGDAASDTLDTITTPNSKPTHGQIITLRAANASRVVTVSVTGGNIIGEADVTLDAADKFVQLMFDQTADQWNIITSANSFTNAEKSKLAAVPVVQLKMLSADESPVNNSTTTVATPLTFNVEAGALYRVEFQFFYDTVTGAGFRTDLSASAGSLSGQWAPLDGANSIAAVSINGAQTAISGTTERAYSVAGFLSCDEDATITVAYAQSTAMVGDTTLKDGSWLQVTKVP